MIEELSAMNFAIRYLTSYQYDGEVVDNLNALRVKPATTQHQRVDDFGVRTDPETRLQQHLDYYGTTVIEFGISRPHEHLAIDVRARVVTAAPGAPPDPSWDEIENPAYRSAGIEYLQPWASEPDDIRIDELVGLTRAETPLGTLRRLVELVPDRFAYQAGVTYVGSTVRDLLDGGAGVCQDFAHLALLMLRRNGIAARYASGYLFAPPDGDESADSAEVDTHAWVEALLPGPGESEPVWIGVDPTNRCLTGDHYVKIGHGRFYADVPPIKGVYRGPGTSDLDVTVKMHRVA
ncbi:MAG: transglutaminase family protein [Solirubrobacteraceae bacterium]